MEKRSFSRSYPILAPEDKAMIATTTIIAKQLAVFIFTRTFPIGWGDTPPTGEALAQRIPCAMVVFKRAFRFGCDQNLPVKWHAKSARKIAAVASDAAVGNYATSRHFQSTISCVKQTLSPLRPLSSLRLKNVTRDQTPCARRMIWASVAVAAGTGSHVSPSRITTISSASPSASDKSEVAMTTAIPSSARARSVA